MLIMIEGSFEKRFILNTFRKFLASHLSNESASKLIFEYVYYVF